MLLAGCGNHGFMVSAISVPAKFDAYTCKQLTGLTALNIAEIKRIEGAMSKASTATVGPAINFAVHSSRLAQLRADKAYLAETYAEKKCEAEVAPALPSPPRS